MNVTPLATAVVLLGLTSTAGASELTFATPDGARMTAWTDGDCSAVSEATSRRDASLTSPPTCTTGDRRTAAVTLATAGGTQFVADGRTGAIRAVKGGETTELFQPFRTRRDASKRRMVTALVNDDVVTFHITTFTPDGGREAAETTAVHYNTSTLAVVNDRRTEPQTDYTPVLSYWNAN